MVDQLRAVAYLRVSTEEQADSAAGLDAQRAAISEMAARRGWAVVDEQVDAGVSGKSMGNRPALAAALSWVERGDADVLVVAKLDRLSRSVVDFSQTLARAAAGEWSLAVIDVDVDMTSPSGELMAHIVASMAQYERRLIGERTRVALAVKREQGVRLGRPRTLPLPVVARVVAERAEGATLAAIGAGLERDGVATAQRGARWWPGTVRAVLMSQAGQLAVST